MEDNTQTTKEEDKKFKDIFPWEHKNEYNYKLITIVDENKDLNLKEEKSFVYFGRDKKDKKKCVFVKGMNLKHEKTPPLMYVLREIFLNVALISIQYFCKLDDVLLSNDFVFLIYKEKNIDLKDLIEYRKNYEKKIKEIVYRIILGLNILHSNGIIHNDIKPANILINDQYHSSICDFGSFTFLGELPKYLTLEFASPELLMNSKDINGKSDMFSLGLTILCTYRREQRIFEQKDNPKKQLDYLKDFFSRKSYPNTPNKLYEKYIKNIEDRDLRDLLKNLLTWEPEKRFSAEDALNSNYFKDLYPSKDGIEKIHFPIDKNKIQKKKIEPKEFYDLFDQIKKYLKV